MIVNYEKSYVKGEYFGKDYQKIATVACLRDIKIYYNIISKVTF